MTEQAQPEALRLADWIDSDFDPDEMHEFGYDQIAAELRSQHAEVQELRTERDRYRRLFSAACEALGAAIVDPKTQLAQRPALTDEQRREMLDRLGAAAEGLDGDTWDQMVISATERAHGIGDPT